jgi:hypothetical protein
MNFFSPGADDTSIGWYSISSPVEVSISISPEQVCFKHRHKRLNVLIKYKSVKTTSSNSLCTETYSPLASPIQPSDLPITKRDVGLAAIQVAALTRRKKKGCLTRPLPRCPIQGCGKSLTRKINSDSKLLSFLLSTHQLAKGALDHLNLHRGLRPHKPDHMAYDLR